MPFLLQPTLKMFEESKQINKQKSVTSSRQSETQIVYRSSTDPERRIAFEIMFRRKGFGFDSSNRELNRERKRKCDVGKMIVEQSTGDESQLPTFP